MHYHTLILSRLYLKPNKALANRASGVNKLLALIGDLVAVKFCLPLDHFDHYTTVGIIIYEVTRTPAC